MSVYIRKYRRRAIGEWHFFVMKKVFKGRGEKQRTFEKKKRKKGKIAIKRVK